ncbi:MAG: putative collagen-binding domain-containing protein, partial [Bacteroidota bacterium]
MLSGAAGFTYGNNAVWQMFKKRGPVAIPCLYDWKESLERPGANQIRHLHQLVSETKLWEQRPDQSLVYGANPSGREHIRAVMTPAGDRAVVYLSVGQEVHLVMSKLRGDTFVSEWFDPREGIKIQAGTFTNSGIQAFAPPSSGEGNDWLLILTKN